MIPPLADPPHRRTAHGAPMSPRLSRLYTWLQANNVALTDFSTDECVQREMARLNRLRDELAAALSNAQEYTPYLHHLATDLANLMRRVPANRVTR
ncbi:hypothetical protein [Microbacterium sp.]|uniref:hypothetical protein n=1 Tax=Microbacterium sp. TaxID=51671 RepID=UPI002E30F717|nr:hypothetical protein [Microbacterium sp.]HEX5728444.1 hypothetical protein [Microbacterium sp.]